MAFVMQCNLVYKKRSLGSTKLLSFIDYNSFTK